MTHARSWGVQAEYHDAAGRLVVAPAESVAAVRAALGGDDPDPPAPLFLHPGDTLDHPLELVTEDGRSLLVEGTVGADVPLGYHAANTPGGPRHLVVSPRRCHLPEGLCLGGWAVQVYSGRSAASWGIGDLADLRSFGEWAAARGARFTLVNPLNAAVVTPPVEPSPYLPTSRRWRNPLYLRVEEVPGATLPGADLERAAAAGRALNGDRRIDRDAVAAIKLDALRRIAAAAPLPEGFAAWRAAQGEDLERFATFSVIAADHGADFRAWPAELQASDGAAAAAVRVGAAAAVEFHAWLQWLLEQQLAHAAAALPLVTDLPIGVDPGGADVWADPGLFARDFSVGVPPDEFNTLGQDWAQPPWNPSQLRARGYAPLVAVLRAGFAHAMGLRVDHVMGLFRLFWIPAGADPRTGVYVRYPAAEMLDILALESDRAGAVVVGEDLGTVEPAVREEMAARQMLGSVLLYFTDADPSAFPRRALSTVTTHDLPTVAGLWSGADTAEVRSIGVPVNDAALAEVRARVARVAADGGDGDSVATVIVNAHRALAASPSMLVAAALEDAAACVERPNVPGTTAELRPNWSQALPLPLEQVLASPLAERLAQALRRDQPGSACAAVDGAGQG
ncbi:MAG TPA: 4-alpha-glucanotransferase [Candidatus Dormibacteraeota bacterium]